MPFSCGASPIMMAVTIQVQDDVERGTRWRLLSVSRNSSFPESQQTDTTRRYVMGPGRAVPAPSLLEFMSNSAWSDLDTSM